MVLNGAGANITGCLFEGNTATLGGAGLYVQGASPSDTVSIFNTVFRQNSALPTLGAAYGYGGGIFFTSLSPSGPNPLVITGSTFESNSAASIGGALSVVDTLVSISDTTFTCNSATTDGGAIHFARGAYSTSTNLTLSVNEFVGNLALKYGGAIYANARGNVITSTNTFYRNWSVIRGGAIYCASNTTAVRFASDSFTDNSAASTASSGAVYFSDDCGCSGGETVLLVNNHAPVANSSWAGIAGSATRCGASDDSVVALIDGLYPGGCNLAPAAGGVGFPPGTGAPGTGNAPTGASGVLQPLINSIGLVLMLVCAFM